MSFLPDFFEFDLFWWFEAGSSFIDEGFLRVGYVWGFSAMLGLRGFVEAFISRLLPEMKISITRRRVGLLL